MAKLTPNDMHILELLFERPRFDKVLDFDDKAFVDFFKRAFEIDVTSDPYDVLSEREYVSWADQISCLRKFYDRESDEVVGKAIELLVSRAKRLCEDGKEKIKPLRIEEGYAIARRLQGLEVAQKEKTDMSGNEGMDSVAKKLKEISFDKMPIEDKFKPILKNRLDEAVLCYKNETYLATIVMAGSVLEGALLGYATKHPEKFKGQKNPENLRLKDLIDACEKNKVLNEAAKGLSETVRVFRNYIHPDGQMTDKFTVRKEDAESCLFMLDLVLRQLK